MERKWAIIVAAALGLLAVFLTNIYFREKEQRFRVEEAPVLVAARDISKGAVIDYDMLAFKSMPVKFVQPGALGSKESAVGKTALVTIVAGEQVLATKLAHPRAGLTLAGKTPPGNRAVTIGLETSSAVGGMIRPGDHVDVLAIFTTPPLIITLFQNVLILAVDQQMVPEPEGRKRDERAPAPTARLTITFALTPQEVQILTVAMENGKIRLTLRPQMEADKVLPAVDLTNLPPMVDYNTLLQLYYPRTTEKPVPSVEVIRGLKKEWTPIPTR